MAENTGRFVTKDCLLHPLLSRSCRREAYASWHALLTAMFGSVGLILKFEFREMVAETVSFCTSKAYKRNPRDIEERSFGLSINFRGSSGT